MILKIISDGTAYGTNIVDAETGERVTNVTDISFKLVSGGVVEAFIKLIGTPVDVDVDTDTMAHIADH